MTRAAGRLRSLDVFLGLPLMVFDLKSRQLGDRLAGTLVVHDRMPEVAGRGVLLGRVPPGWGAREVAVVESFLARAGELGDVGERDAMALRILKRIAADAPEMMAGITPSADPVREIRRALARYLAAEAGGTRLREYLECLLIEHISAEWQQSENGSSASYDVAGRIHGQTDLARALEAVQAFVQVVRPHDLARFRTRLNVFRESLGEPADLARPVPRIGAVRALPGVRGGVPVGRGGCGARAGQPAAARGDLRGQPARRRHPGVVRAERPGRRAGRLTDDAGAAVGGGAGQRGAREPLP